MVGLLRLLRAAPRHECHRMTAELAARRVIETPEGVGVAVELGDLGTRAAALLIDLTIIVCTSLVGLLVLRLLAPLVGTHASMALFAC